MLLEFIALVVVAFLLIRTGLYITWTKVRWEKELGKRVQNREDYGYIYIVRGRGERFYLWKIGRTNNLRRRLMEHRTAISPEGLLLVSAFRVRDDKHAESYIFGEFSDQRTTDETRRGRDPEWFYVTPRLWIMARLMHDRKLEKGISNETTYI